MAHGGPEIVQIGCFLNRSYSCNQARACEPQLTTDERHEDCTRRGQVKSEVIELYENGAKCKHTGRGQVKSEVTELH